MNNDRFLVAATVVATIGALGRSVWADASCARITRANLVRCVLAASVATEVERDRLDAARAREEAARPVLPSNPVLSGWVARRSTVDRGSDFNWAATVAQEVEIGGQRGARTRAAASGRTSQEDVLRATRRDVAAEAWRAYFEVLAAREELALVKNLEETTRRVAEVAKASADRGLGAGVDADVADASFVRIEGARVAAEGRRSQSAARLLSLLGGDPRGQVDIAGSLEPLQVAEQFRAGDSNRAVVDRPEVRALEAESRAELSRADVFRRSRIPSPTVSAFVERDGFAERVVGLGIAVPVPLPHPFGRTYAGEIAEAEAMAKVASARAKRLRREVSRDLSAALAAYEASRRVVELFTPERRSRAETELRAMAAGIEAGRLGVRDAVVAQEALMGLLSAAVVAKRDLCLASVELARAAGAPLEGGVR